MKRIVGNTVFRVMAWSVAMCLLCSGHVWAGNGGGLSVPRDRVKTSTDVLMFAPSVAGLVATLALKDYEGTGQLALGAATGLAVSYAMKHMVSKERPDHSDFHSFPSNHATVAFQGAAFIQRRYGWKYGVPAYLLSTYVAWGRVYARRHDALDVMAGALIGVGGGYLFTRPFVRNYDVNIAPVTFDGHGAGVYMSLRF